MLTRARWAAPMTASNIGSAPAGIAQTFGEQEEGLAARQGPEAVHQGQQGVRGALTLLVALERVKGLHRAALHELGQPDLNVLVDAALRRPLALRRRHVGLPKAFAQPVPGLAHELPVSAARPRGRRPPPSSPSARRTASWSSVGERQQDLQPAVDGEDPDGRAGPADPEVVDHRLPGETSRRRGEAVEGEGQEDGWGRGVSPRVGCPPGTSVDELQGADLLAHPVFEHRDLVPAQVAQQRPVAVADHEIHFHAPGNRTEHGGRREIGGQGQSRNSQREH